MRLTHSLGKVSPERVAQVVKADHEVLKRLNSTTLRILLFAAYEAKATKTPLVDLRHIRLGALRERRMQGDADQADRLRSQIRDDSVVDFPIGLSEDAFNIVRSSKTPADLLR